DDAGAPREKAPRIKRERPAKPDVPASGRVGDVLFPELLLSFYEKRATGTLFIRTGGEERRLSIRNGIPVSIDSNFIAGQSLGAILLEQERISDAQLFHAQKIVAESGQRLGEVLIESGLIDAQELVATLHYQAQRKLMSAFPHDEGEYEFRDGAPDVGDSGHLDESILQILLAGVKNYCTMALLESRIYANRHRVVQKGDVQAARRAGLQLTRQEWAILDLVDGQRTLGDIVSRTPLNFIRTFQVLYLFFLFGLVRFSDGGSDFFQLDEPVLNRALSEARSDATPAPLMPPAVAPPQETESDLLRLLYRLSGLRADGVVIARAGGAMHRIVLSAGKPVKIASEVANALSVGNLLVARGRLTEEDRDRALELAGSEGLPIGEALLKLGLLSPHELYEVLVTQAEERLMALTTDARAVEIQYEARRTEEPRGLPLDVDLVKVLVRAMRLRIKPEHARDELAGDAGKAVAFTASGRARLHPHAFDAKESSVITLIDGRRTLKQIREHSGLGSDETNTLVFALLKLGLIEFLGEG
ncbi:hypothetical protein K8I61_04265, partial [bacterium]|nr:hypothetical protein [bacterium]